MILLNTHGGRCAAEGGSSPGFLRGVFFGAERNGAAMDKIESVRVDQSILGRILGYGRVTIMGTGASTESFGKIDEPVAAPLELRNHITGV